MKGKPFILVSSLIFAVVTILHILRIGYQWPITIGTFVVPQWCSFGGLVFAGALTVWGFWLVGKKK